MPSTLANKMRCLSIILFVSIYLMACRNDVATYSDLQGYIADEENGLQKSVSIGEVKAEVRYRPTDLLVYQAIEGEEQLNSSAVDSVRQHYDKYVYFILNLSANDKEALHIYAGPQYSELLQTLSFRMHDYVTLTTSANDTIPVGDFMLNRTFGMASGTELLFVFSREKISNKDWMQFNLKEIGLGLGYQRFRFDLKDIENIPTLAFVEK